VTDPANQPVYFLHPEFKSFVYAYRSDTPPVGTEVTAAVP
jgi:hypothetical protein